MFSAIIIIIHVLYPLKCAKHLTVHYPGDFNTYPYIVPCGNKQNFACVASGISFKIIHDNSFCGYVVHFLCQTTTLVVVQMQLKDQFKYFAYKQLACLENNR